MVTLIKDDLVHILKQIKIAEEHTRLINAGMDPAAALAQLVTSPRPGAYTRSSVFLYTSP